MSSLFTSELPGVSVMVPIMHTHTQKLPTPSSIFSSILWLPPALSTSKPNLVSSTGTDTAPRTVFFVCGCRHVTEEMGGGQTLAETNEEFV